MLVQTEGGVAMAGERWEMGRHDELYPRRLEDLGDAPEPLYGIGDPSALGDPCISIVGARRATPYGIAVAEMAGRIAAESNITVVSGGAMGCDAAALRAALDAGGRVVVVPGTGADHAYPRTSADLFRRAPEQGGCVVSLAGWGTGPRRWAFPRRNRVIAALSQALVVAEAGGRSGTMSTAECAAELGRDVYAVPGSIFSPESVGANRLIASGAAPICSEEDLEVRISLDYGVSRLLGAAPSRERGRILSALVASPMRPDDLANRLCMPALEALLALSDYEASGMVERLPDGRYAPTKETYATR